MDRRRFLKAGSASATVALAAAATRQSADAATVNATANAQAIPRRDIIRVLAEGAPNSLDPHGDGFNRESLGAFTNVYDTLIRFNRNAIAPGAYRYDYEHLQGLLAEAYEPIKSGHAWRFHLRRDARFHSGRPITADAVKWSLDRAVTLSASKHQLATGSMTDPKQFVVEGPHTLRIDLPRPDRYALPNLALTYASIIDADAVRTAAGPRDPWGSNWLRRHAAGGGAFRVENWQPGQSIDYLRNDDWKSGPLPPIRRAIAQSIPDAANRLAALSRGDADIALQLAPPDFDAAARMPNVRTLSIPLTNTFRFVAFDTQVAPFNDVRVRQAIAYALPYQALFNGVAQGHGAPLFGASPDAAPSTAWPQAYPYSTRLDRARALLADAGMSRGFKTTLTYNASDAAIAEPSALLIQQALRPLNIDITLNKALGSQWGALQTSKQMPFFIDWSSAWFNDPDYFYRIFFEGDWRWNFSSYANPGLVAITDEARWATDPHEYDALMHKAAAIVVHDVPILPLWLPAFDIAMRSDVQGFTYYIHGQVDFRTLRRS